MSEKELCIEKLQKALLKLPKDDLIKLLKNTYQAMKIKHNIPNPQVTTKFTQNPNFKENKSNTKDQCVNKNSRKNTKLTNQNSIHKNPLSNHSQINTNTPKGATTHTNPLTNTNTTNTNTTNKDTNSNTRKGANFTTVVPDTVTEKNSNTFAAVTNPLTTTNTNTLNSNMNGVNMDKYGTSMNVDDRFIDMETFDTMNKDEIEEEITFRSQEFQVQVPELDLTLAHEYVNSKHSKIQKNEEKNILTPKFSFYQTNTTNTTNTNTTNNMNSVTNGVTGVNGVNRVIPNGVGGVNEVTGVNSVNGVNLIGNGMNNVQYLQGYKNGNGMIWAGGPVNFCCLRPVQIIRRPFYPRSRSLQR